MSSIVNKIRLVPVKTSNELYVQNTTNTSWLKEKSEENCGKKGNIAEVLPLKAIK